VLFIVPDASASLHPIDNPHDVPVRLMAGAGVPIEDRAVRQALEVCELAPHLAAAGASLDALVLTPDLHVGPQVPVGMAFDVTGALVPGAIGNDVGCGMRLAVFDDAAAPGAVDLERLEVRLRRRFFEGERDLPLRPADRLAVLEWGLMGLLEAPAVTAGAGLWAHLAGNLAEHLERTHGAGGMDAAGVDDALARWARASGLRDSQLGSLGGGNHFCELQEVVELCDGPTAWSWGVRPGALAVMVHAGSLGFGQVAAGRAREAARADRPAGWRLPERLLPLTGAPAQARYVRAMRNAANLGGANRLALMTMAVGAIADVLGRAPRWVTVGDSPHNLVWRDGERWRHRKGACPAGGAGGAGPFAYTGEPVLVPGSMGDSSWLLAGSGAGGTLASTCHGAGRVLSRGRAARLRDDDEDAGLRVVTPVDPVRVVAQGRSDLLEEHARRLREEAPRAYKPVAPVVDAVVAAGAARKVARLRPLLTVKG
jgi:tRNA-splicing ligase RtcB